VYISKKRGKISDILKKKGKSALAKNATGRAGYPVIAETDRNIRKEK
jgi:hypothetical protein